MSHRKRSRLRCFGLAAVVVCTLAPTAASAQSTEDLVIRGRRQVLHLYGPADGEPVVVSSGDGGWIHLGAACGGNCSPPGASSSSASTSRRISRASRPGERRCEPEDEPGDYKVLADCAARAARPQKPILVGVSEGAGLSVLAATDPGTKSAIAGVVGLGLPNINELGWRWKDA